MAGPITNYHTDQVVASFLGENINGFADDTFIEVERNEDGWTLYVGALGDKCRTRNLNRSGKITFTLMATAPVNDRLATFANDDETFGFNFGPIQIKDLNGNMVCHGSEAWIMKQPKVERAKDSGTIQWVIEVADLTIVAGGNVV